MNTPVAPAAILRKVMEDPHATHRVYEERALKSPMGDLYVYWSPPNENRPMGQVELKNDIFDASFSNEIPEEVWTELLDKGHQEILIEGVAFQILTPISEIERNVHQGSKKPD